VLEEDACSGLERTAERDQPACLRELDLGVVRHQRGVCGVEAETGQLVEPPEARLTQLLGLLGLDMRLDLLSRLHNILSIVLQGPTRYGPFGSSGPSSRPSFMHSACRVAIWWESDNACRMFSGRGRLRR
jgi:hypothetical protein